MIGSPQTLIRNQPTVVSEVVSPTPARLLSARSMPEKKFNALPGFGLTMGFTLFYLSALVIIPIGGLFVRGLGVFWGQFLHLARTGARLGAYQPHLRRVLVAA